MIAAMTVAHAADHDHDHDQEGSFRQQVAEEVRAWMARRRISGAELARRIGRSQTFVAKRLDGRQAFDMDDLEIICRELGISPAELMSDIPFLIRPATPDLRRRGDRMATGGRGTRVVTVEFPQPSLVGRRPLLLVPAPSAGYRRMAGSNGSPTGCDPENGCGMIASLLAGRRTEPPHIVVGGHRVNDADAA